MAVPVTVADVRDRAARLFARGARAWATGDPSDAQIDIPLHPPTEVMLRTGFDGPAWASEWRIAERELEVDVQWTTRQWTTFGSQEVPRRINVNGPTAIAALAGERVRWARWRDRVALLTSVLPAESDVREAVLRAIRSRLRSIGDLPESDWQTYVAVTAWLINNPVSGQRLRELPIRGIDTKWLESHRHDVEMVVSAATGRLGLGLNEDDRNARIRFLDPGVRLAGISDLSSPLSELAMLQVPAQKVVVIENLQTFLAMPAFKETIAFYGAGNRSAALDRTLVQLPWARDARILYWGDLDSQGLQILDRARRTGIAIESLLMDSDTLLAFRDMAVDEPQPATGAMDRLLPGEREALDLLRELGNIRLEQERIPWQHAVKKLEAALGEPAIVDLAIGNP